MVECRVTQLDYLRGISNYQHWTHQVQEFLLTHGIIDDRKIKASYLYFQVGTD